MVSQNKKVFIKPDNCKAVKMHGMVKTPKVDNPVCGITGGSNTAVENLSILVKKILYVVPEQLTSEIKDTNDIFDVIDSINVSVLT